jgi:uncharacterized membrane protein
VKPAKAQPADARGMLMMIAAPMVFVVGVAAATAIHLAGLIDILS